MRLCTVLVFLLALPVSGEYAEIHGLKMYYEVHGEGRPVVLLHGGFNTIQTSFAEQIKVLARNHRVIAIEQMGHGHTADVPGRELSYEGMTEDTAALLVQLRIRNADVIGWSDGGQLALRLAFTHPELVRRVVVSGVGIGATTPENCGKRYKRFPPTSSSKMLTMSTRACHRTALSTGVFSSRKAARCGPNRTGAFRSRNSPGLKRQH